MTTLLLLGFLIGMRHALEADHVAAVASLATRSRTIGETVRHGAVWGVGHTLTLFLFGSLVIWMDGVMPEQLALWLELAVGIMLIILGIDVLRRIIRDKIHFHVHRHDDGETHFHAHSHAGEKHHDSERHHHHHKSGFPVRALLVGLMHGMAGSAALILLTIETIHSPWTGMLYIALFGIGSIVGMALFSAIIAIPLRTSEKSLTWLHNGLHSLIGVTTITIGVSVITSTY